MSWTWSLLFLLAALILFVIASGWPYYGAGSRWNEGLIAAGLACFMASILAGGH